jgi:DNA primase
MILNDLFESRMSELDIEYQDYKNLEPVAFLSRYKMSKDQWANKHWSLIKGSETVHEGAVKDLYTELEEKYRELAPSIEKYKDSFLAGQLYDALEAIAIEHGAELEFKRMMTGARNRAHMDYDTNPGGFQNWFWYLPFADDITEESQDDRNARIIAGEIEDAMSQGNAELAKQKIKELIRAGYTLDKDGNLQRMGMYEESELQEKQDACYHKVKSRYKVWPSAYASGALVQCRKKGAANWGNKSKK